MFTCVKNLRILPAFTHSITKSFTAIFCFCSLESWLVVVSWDHSLLLRAFCCTSGHHSHTAGDKTWCKPIPGRDTTALSKSLRWDPNAPASDQTWGGLGPGSWRVPPRGGPSSARCAPLGHCSALSPPRVISEHFIPTSTQLLKIYSLWISCLVWIDYSKSMWKTG